MEVAVIGEEFVDNEVAEPEVRAGAEVIADMTGNPSVLIVNIWLEN